MSPQEPDKETPSVPPVSKVGGVAGQLLEQGLLSAPSKPGLLANLGQYEILSLIGEGGMGIVFKGRDDRSGQSVAIKLLKPELAVEPQMVHRFLKEARHIKRLQHPHIVPVLQVLGEDSRPYFVMPFMERGSLARLISPESQLSATEVLSIARSLASALGYAHSRGVIHRDLKPGNVLLDASDQVFLSDFGLARTVFNDSWLDPSKPASCEGTAPYMSPQQARGEAEDTRCDIYALGALLYEMLTGQPPYEGQSTEAVLQQIRQGPPPSILKIRSKASSDLIQVAQGAMAREHRDRYANMEDLARDLERIDDGKLPTGPRNRWQLRPRELRGKLMVLSVCAVIAALFGGMVYRSHISSGPMQLELVRSLTPQDIRSWGGAQMGDFDGDGQPDIVLMQDEQLHVFSSAGGTRKAINLNLPNDNGLSLSHLADVNGDGIVEAFVSWTSGTSAHLAAFNAQAYPVSQFQKEGTLNVHKTWGTNYTWLNALQLVDLDRDGRQELLASVSSTWALQPRGLACFDLETGTEQWFFPMAGFVEGIITGDLDGDHRQEILIGSLSPANGAVLPDGTDDAHAYVFALAADGQLLWRQPAADYFGRVEPLGFTQGEAGAKDVLISASTDYEHHEANGDPETGSVIRLSAQGQILRRYDIGMNLPGVLMADLESEGHPEILVADRTGWLHVLDESLNLLKRVHVVTNDMTWVNLNPVAAVVPHPGSPRKQVVLTSSHVEKRTRPNPGSTAADVAVFLYHDNELIVLDQDLKPTVHHPIAKLWAQHPGFKVMGLSATEDRHAEVSVFTSQADVYHLKAP